MQLTPKEIADRLVQMYGNSPKGLHMPREDFEQHAERPGVDLGCPNQPNCCDHFLDLSDWPQLQQK
jgi:hypothetical protein